MGTPAASSTILRLRGYGVAFGERIVLSDVNLEVPERGPMVILGPGGTGKSTLLRTLAGFNATNPSLRTWGEAHYAGAPLGDGELPALVSQSAKLMMASVLDNMVHELPERRSLTPLQQRDLVKRLLARAGLAALVDCLDRRVVKLPLAQQRHLAILRLAAAGPKLLCLDEPTTGLSDADSAPLLETIRRESTQRAVLVVLHNQEQARALGGVTALLAGGVIQELRPTPEFFTAPRGTAAREFVRNGNCAVAAPDARPDELDAGVAPPPPIPEAARRYVSDAFGPRGFLWLKHGRLAGTPRPGVYFDLDYDLKALRRVGVTVLVSLTETPLDADALPPYGMRSIRFPVPDMGAPSVERAADLCRQIDTLLAADEVLAVHCRAGLGRTGTVLAAYLIWEGHSALDALESVRRVEPRWVQSEEQVGFLEEFAGVVANGVPTRHTGMPATAARRSPDDVPQQPSQGETQWHRN
jgi:atypical dual specificity phosphatase